jgi:pyruvate formate lyase activating enzyme
MRPITVEADDLAIAGFVPFSTVDWPGKLTATLFLQGCPWGCAYCQNPGLMDPTTLGVVSWGEVWGTLDRRVGLLDGVVFSGGEPTRQDALVPAIAEVRQLGFAAAVHTSGAYPTRLEEILPDLSWVGLDIKAPVDRYAAVTGIDASGERAWRSLDLVMASGVDYEIRVTVDPVTLTRRDIEDIVRELKRRGAHRPILQEARAEGTRPEYAARLGNARLADVIPPDALPEIERRLNLESGADKDTVREALARRGEDDASTV